MKPVKNDKTLDKSAKASDKELPETYTLRLPVALRKRVERLAESKRVSLNQQIVRILEIYFVEAGSSEEVIKSLSGRLFEVKGEKYEGHGERAVLIDLQIFEARSQNKIASLNFGVDLHTMKQLHIQESDEESAVQELARTILRYYLRQGIEPEAISWSQYADRGYTNTRILHSEEIPKGVCTFDDFVIAINQDDWFDWPFVGNYLQDLNRRICNARELSESISLAEEVWTLLCGTTRLGGLDSSWVTLEKELLAAIINITAQRAGVARSQLRYMRALVNSSKYLVFEALGEEKFKKLVALSKAEPGCQSMLFARVNQMLLSIAPQPVVPALSAQKSMGGFSF